MAPSLCVEKSKANRWKTKHFCFILHRNTVSQVSHGDPKWQEWLELDIPMVDMPRSTKLCLSICSVRKRKGREEHMMLSWANINMFDFRQRLLSGSYRYIVKSLLSSHE